MYPSLEEALVQLPIKLHWDGWDTDTYRLKATGWKIWATERHSPTFKYKSICLSVKHPRERLVLAGYENLDPFMQWGGKSVYDFLLHGGINLREYMESDRITTLHNDYHEIQMLQELRQIDGFAYLPDPAHIQYTDLRELPIFRYNETAGEIFLPQASVDQCLSQILKVQYPTQELLRKDSTLIKPVLQAKIYSLAA